MTAMQQVTTFGCTITRSPLVRASTVAATVALVPLTVLLANTLGLDRAETVALAVTSLTIAGVGFLTATVLFRFDPGRPTDWATCAAVVTTPTAALVQVPLLLRWSGAPLWSALPLIVALVATIALTASVAAVVASSSQQRAG